MEELVRGDILLGIITVMLLWEYRRPRRPQSRQRQERCGAKLGLTLLNTVLVRFYVGGVASTAWVFSADQRVCLLDWTPLAGLAACVVTVRVL